MVVYEHQIRHAGRVKDITLLWEKRRKACMSLVKLPQIDGLTWHKENGFQPGLVKTPKGLELCGHIEAGSDLHRAITRIAEDYYWYYRVMPSDINVTEKHYVHGEDYQIKVGTHLRAVHIQVRDQKNLRTYLNHFSNHLQTIDPKLAPAIV